MIADSFLRIEMLLLLLLVRSWPSDQSSGGVELAPKVGQASLCTREVA